jgi:hypothetical protein
LVLLGFLWVNQGNAEVHFFGNGYQRPNVVPPSVAPKFEKGNPKYPPFTMWEVKNGRSISQCAATRITGCLILTAWHCVADAVTGGGVPIPKLSTSRQNVRAYSLSMQTPYAKDPIQVTAYEDPRVIDAYRQNKMMDDEVTIRVKERDCKALQQAPDVPLCDKMPDPKDRILIGSQHERRTLVAKVRDKQPAYSQNTWTGVIKKIWQKVSNRKSLTINVLNGQVGQGDSGDPAMETLPAEDASKKDKLCVFGTLSAIPVNNNQNMFSSMAYTSGKDALQLAKKISEFFYPRPSEDNILLDK